MFENLAENIQSKIKSFQVPPEVKAVFENFLSQMGASTKKTVTISFSSNLGLELVEIDNVAGIVTKYANKPLEYDSSNRKIYNYNEFAKDLTEFFEEFDISPTSNVVLSLQNIYFGLIEVPGILQEDMIKNVILSEVEQSYIFKSNEPLVTWDSLTKDRRDKTKPNSLVYAAIQKDVVDGIIEACQNIGCKFISIEDSHVSILRGLSYLGLIENQLKDGVIWQLMIIAQNSYSILTMNGTTPIDYFEEPLAMKSFQDDEIYNAISSSSSEILNREDSTSLILVSETDLVSAELLSNQINSHQMIQFIDCNKYSQNALMQTSLDILPEIAEQITLSAIGTAAYAYNNFPIKLNFIRETVAEREVSDFAVGNLKVNLGNLEISLTKSSVRKLALILGSIMLIPLLLVYLIIGQWILPKELDKSNSLAANIEAINRQISDLSETNKQAYFDIDTMIDKIIKQNKKTLFQYSALGEIVPKNLWITHMEDSDAGFLMIGVATSTHVIYDFYKNLKLVGDNNSLTLSKLSFTDEPLDNFVSLAQIPESLYKFEITSAPEMGKNNLVRSVFNLGEEKAEEIVSNPKSRVTVSVPPAGNSIEEVEKDADSAKKTDSTKKTDTTKNADTKQKANSTTTSDGEKLPPNLKKIEKF